MILRVSRKGKNVPVLLSSFKVIHDFVIKFTSVYILVRMCLMPIKIEDKNEYIAPTQPPNNLDSREAAGA